MHVQFDLSFHQFFFFVYDIRVLTFWWSHNYSADTSSTVWESIKLFKPTTRMKIRYDRSGTTFYTEWPMVHVIYDGPRGHFQSILYIYTYIHSIDSLILVEFAALHIPLTPTRYKSYLSLNENSLISYSTSWRSNLQYSQLKRKSEHIKESVFIFLQTEEYLLVLHFLLHLWLADSFNMFIWVPIKESLLKMSSIKHNHFSYRNVQRIETV